MNKLGKWTVPAILVGVVILVVAVLASTYNGLVQSRESVNKAWANVEAQYQRRNDLIPNLVSTVKGAANFEQETLTAVVDARAKATQITVNANNPEDIERFQQAQGEVSSSLSRLLAVAENYPQLQAVQSFRDLQVQLEGTENRIAVARQDFNTAVQPYNVKVQTFPTNLVAGMFGFEKRPSFTADKGAEIAPKVDFGN